MSERKLNVTLHSKALTSALKQAEDMLEVMAETGDTIAPEVDVKTISVTAKDGSIHVFSFLVFK